MNSQQQIDPLSVGKKKKPFDPFGFLFRYGALIVVFGLFSLTMMIPLVLKVKKPDYEVHATLKIDPVIPSLITKSEQPSITSYYHDFVRTQAKRINDHTTMAMALEKLGTPLANQLLSPSLSEEAKISILRRIVRVEPISRTHLINLSIRGPKKTGLAPLLNALMESYLEKMTIELQQKDARRLTYLKTKKMRLRVDIQEREHHLNELASQVLSSTFVEDFNIWQQRVVNLQSAYVNALSKRVEAENSFTFRQDTVDRLTLLSLDSLVDEGVMADDAIDFTSSWTYQKLQEMRGSIDGITESNNDRKRIEHRMQAMRDYEGKLLSETRDTVKNIVYGKQDLELKTSLILKENSYKEALANERNLESELKAAQQMSGIKSTLLLKGKGLETELTHDRNLLFRIDTRIHELEAESRAPLRVSIESVAKEPRHPVGSNIKKLLLTCFALSFGSVGGFFLIIEFFDNRIHSPKNIIHALGHPPTWPISRAPDGAPFSSILRSAPSSVTAKAIRSLATRLFREYEENDAKVFLFSGVENTNGTSSITDNIAEAFAYHSEKVLLVDANIQSWQDIEISEESCKNKEPLSTIQRDEKKGVDYLVATNQKLSTRHSARAFNDILQEAREKYDFICIDSAPILQSDLTEHLAAKSDVAILITRGDSTTYSKLRHSAEILIRLEVPALAPVLNWGGPKQRMWFEKYIEASSAILGVIKRYRIIPKLRP